MIDVILFIKMCTSTPSFLNKHWGRVHLMMCVFFESVIVGGERMMTAMFSLIYWVTGASQLD